eukprot:s2897_g7.t1
MPLCVMKWTHRICFEEYYVSPWQALENAFVLAMEMDEISHRAYHSNVKFPAKVLEVGRPNVSFASVVEVALCDDDNFDLKHFSYSEDAFFQWPDKPWRLRPTTTSARQATSMTPALPVNQLRLTDAYYDVPSNWGFGEHAQHGHAEDDDNQFHLHEAPQSIQDLFNYFQRQWVIEGPGLVDSIYLRVGMFTMSTHHNGSILALLSSMVIGDFGNEIFLKGGVTKLLQVKRLSLHLPLAAGLISVLQPNDRASREHYTLAASLPAFVSGHQLATTSHAGQECFLSGCTIKHGRVHIPVNADPVHEMSNGDTFTLQVFDRPAAGASGTANEGLHEYDEEMNGPGDASGDAPMEGDPDDAPDVSPSPSTPAADPQGLHILRLGHPPSFGYVDWRSYFVILREAAQTVGVPFTQFVGFHYMQHPLVGQAEAEETIILQHVNDIAVGSEEKLIVIDVVMHLTGEQRGVPFAPEVTRRVYKVLPWLARQHVLATAGVAAYCQWMNDQCVVHRNGRIWHLADAQLHEIQHGTYIRIQVPPPCQPDWDPGLAIRVAQGACDLFDFPEAGLVATAILNGQAATGALPDPPTQAASPDGTFRRRKPCELEGDIDVHMLFAPGARMPRLRPRHDGAMDWILHLAELFATEAEIEVLEGDPLLYVQTWYVHHDRHPVCRRPRPLRLDGASVAWIEELRFTWRDLLDPVLPFSIHVVKPRPPQLRTQPYAGHIVLEQARPAGRSAGIVTKLFEGLHNDALEQFAKSMPRFVRVPDVIDELQLQPFCDVRRCTITTAGNPLHLILVEELLSGFNLCVRMGVPYDQRPRLPTDPITHFDDVNLLQAAIHRWSTSEPFQALTRQAAGVSGCATDLPLPPNSETLRFNFDSRAPEIRLAPVDLTQQSVLVRQLYSHWDLHAFAWEAEEGFGHIMTWFVDQRHGITRSYLARPVYLGEAVDRWQDLIRSAWLEFLEPGEELEYFVVNPVPPRLEEGICAHVIVVYSPVETLVTGLVTLQDEVANTISRFALTTPILIEHYAFLHVAGLAERCLGGAAPSTCEIWHGDERLHADQQLPGHNGAGFLVQLGPAEHALGASQESWPQRNIRISFGEVIQQFESFDQHMFLPVYDLPCIADDSEAARWTRDWWDCRSSCDTICIYVDGSYGRHCEGAVSDAGAAVAAFVRQSGVWRFGGALSSALSQASNAYVAELFGAIVAHKFAYDLLKLHEQCAGCCPALVFRFDALTVGRQAEGAWSSYSFPYAGQFLRALSQLLESRYGAQAHYQHVRGHTGEVGNELVDALAAHARLHGGLTPFDEWVTDQTKPCGASLASWYWLLFAPKFSAYWQDEHLAIPTPRTTPGSEVVPTLEVTSMSQIELVAKLQIRLTTCNVLSLTGTKDTDTNMAGIARQAALLRQLDEEQMLIFAFQETRLKKLHQACDPSFFLCKSAATPAGHYGIMIGFAKNRPYGSVPREHGRQQLLYFKDDHFAIVSFDPRYLVVKVAAPYLRCLVIAAHAPHTGHSADDVAAWWTALEQSVPHHLKTWPIILLCDANASVGAEPSTHIGDFQAGKFDERALPFESYVANSDLWLPATFAECQDGDGDTWMHSSGSTKRLDYIGIPRSWSTTHCRAWVSQAIDPSLLRQGHSAACVEFACLSAGRPPLRHDDQAKLRHLDPQRVHWIGLDDATPFEVDVHSHLHHLQQQLVQHLRPFQGRPHRRPLKATMTEATWELVCEKRVWKEKLIDYNKLQKTATLEQIFLAWKSGRASCQDEFGRLRQHHDLLIAQALWHFRRLGRLVTAAMRSDDKRFFSNLLEDGAEFLQPKDVKQLWAVVRRSLPKFQTRRIGYSPYKLECLEEASACHFSQLEMGEHVTKPELLQRCLDRQALAAQNDLPEVVTLSSLPSLLEVENSLRATQADRATGFDAVPSNIYHHHAAFLGRLFYQVLLKMFLWGAEPLQSKGGALRMIPKRIGAIEAHHFRGILLLPSLAKRVHAIARHRLMEQMGRKRDPSQLGGYAGQQVAFGAQTLRVLSNIFAAKGWSSAVDPVLLRLLRDIHVTTWYSLRGTDLVQTFRGTRPGSPLADAIFHLLMSDVASELRQWILAQPAYMALLNELNLEPTFIVWSDDFAIPWATSTASELVVAVTSLMKVVHELFSRRGFLVNYEVGKTCACLTFQGASAPEMRRQYLLTSRPSVSLDIAPGQHQWLHFVVKYKHLGSIASASQSFDPELRYRLGMARTAFQKSSKAILCNRHYPLRLRLQFFSSLICSRLFFGIGSWSTPSLAQLTRLRTEYHRMLRAVLREERDVHMSTAQLLVQTQAVDVRVRIAVDRLLYARMVFQVGPAYLQQLLHIEHEVCPQSWFAGLAADLVWLRPLVPDALPPADDSGFTTMIECWQADALPWKRLLRRALKKHRIQEEMMSDVFAFHDSILATLRSAGATFSPDVDVLFAKPRDELHRCECGRTFTTSQGLALHRLKKHGLHAPEYAFVSGATCPVCLVHFWTSNRLAMHLAYMPRNGGVNRCFSVLEKQGYTVEHQRQLAPPEWDHAVRMDAVPVAGPRPQFEDQRVALIRSLQGEIQTLENALIIPPLPFDPVQQGAHLGDVLTKGTRSWIAAFRRRDKTDLPELMDCWIRLLSVLGDEHDEWVASVFLHWGQHILPEIIADEIDGQTEHILEESFTELAYLFPRQQHQARLVQVRHRLHRLQDEYAQPEQPHRPVRRGTANVGERIATQQKVPSAYYDQVTWHATFRQLRWQDLPHERHLPLLPSPDNVPTLLVVHLFSGRRRAGDLHWQLQQLAPRLGVRFQILSMDTAVLPWWGRSMAHLAILAND